MERANRKVMLNEDKKGPSYLDLLNTQQLLDLYNTANKELSCDPKSANFLSLKSALSEILDGRVSEIMKDESLIKATKTEDLQGLYNYFGSSGDGNSSEINCDYGKFKFLYNALERRGVPVTVTIGASINNKREQSSASSSSASTTTAATPSIAKQCKRTLTTTAMLQQRLFVGAHREEHKDNTNVSSSTSASSQVTSGTNQGTGLTNGNHETLSVFL